MGQRWAKARASKAFLLLFAHRLNDTRPRALEEAEGKAKRLLVLRCAIVVFSLACQPYAHLMTGTAIAQVVR
jgi:hypothetical protein